MVKPQGYPFLFFGHEPALAAEVAPRYGLQFTAPIPFHAGRHHELVKVFTERLAREGLEGLMTFDVARGSVAVARVLQPLSGFPARLTGQSSATVGVIDQDRLVVTKGSVAMLLAHEAGLYRPVSAFPLTAQSFHAATGLSRLALVASAYGPGPASIHVLAAVGRRWVPLARTQLGAETFSMKSELAGLIPVTRGGRVFVEAEFASRGRSLQTRKYAELTGFPAVPPDEASAVFTATDFPVGASTAKRLPDGGWLALFARVTPPEQSPPGAARGRSDGQVEGLSVASQTPLPQAVDLARWGVRMV